jgi:hypothetical protein
VVVGVPVTAMASVLDKGMMMVMFIEPPFVVMIVVGKGLASTGDNESGAKSEEKEGFFGIFHGCII